MASNRAVHLAFIPVFSSWGQAVRGAGGDPLARPRIKPMEGRQILNYLILNHIPREATPEEQDGTPFQRYCTHCHTWAEMAAHRLDQEGWEKVVHRMHGHAPKLVPLEQAAEIAAYLAKQLGRPPAQ